MSLDKAVNSGKKEKRKPYTGREAVYTDCRPGGGCPVCENNRKHSMKKKLLSLKEMERGESE